MKKQILFVHSAGSQENNEGSSDILNYLESNLGNEYEIHHPKLPEPENPNYEFWKNRIVNELELLHEPVMLIGHSLGGSVLLKFLSEEHVKNAINGLFLIAPPYWGKAGGWQTEQFILAHDFASKLPGIPRTFLYHSRDDEWVPFSHLFQYAEAIPGLTVRKFGIRGHNFTGGFPELVKDIDSLEQVYNPPKLKA